MEIDLEQYSIYFPVITKKKLHKYYPVQLHSYFFLYYRLPTTN